MLADNLNPYAASLARILAVQAAALATGFWLLKPHKEPRTSAPYVGSLNLSSTLKIGAMFTLNAVALAASIGYELGSSRSACPKQS